MEYVEGKTLRQLMQQGCLLMTQLLDQLRSLGLADDAEAILTDFLKRNPMAEDGPLREFRIDHLRSP